VLTTGEMKSRYTVKSHFCTILVVGMVYSRSPGYELRDLTGEGSFSR
jgi:hypothetical protein